MKCNLDKAEEIAKGNGNAQQVLSESEVQEILRLIHCEIKTIQKQIPERLLQKVM